MVLLAFFMAFVLEEAMAALSRHQLQPLKSGLLVTLLFAAMLKVASILECQDKSVCPIVAKQSCLAALASELATVDFSKKYFTRSILAVIVASVGAVEHAVSKSAKFVTIEEPAMNDPVSMLVPAAFPRAATIVSAAEETVRVKALVIAVPVDGVATTLNEKLPAESDDKDALG